MEFNGKKIMEEIPAAYDEYRQRYIDGIEDFIKRIKDESTNKRRLFMSPESLYSNSEKYRTEFYKMLGLDKTELLKTSRPVKSVFAGSDDFCDIFCLTVYITDEIPLYAMLFIPHGAKNAPLVVVQHGGGGTPELCSDMNGKNNYNHIVRRFLEKGAIVLAPQLLLWSKEESETTRAYKVTYDRHTVDLSLKRFGLSITALEIKGIMNCITYACHLKNVCADKISMAGISYGGYFTLYTMAADTRIKAGYVAAAFNDRNIYDWSDMSYPSSAIKFNDAEVAALCAPRKLYIQIGKSDNVFDYRSAITEFERAVDYYKIFNKENNLKLSLWDGGHSISDDDDGIEFILK